MSKRKPMKSVANGFRILALACAVVIALVTIVGKGSSSGPSTTAVALNPATASGPIPVNVDFQVNATATLSNGSTQNVTSSSQWTSSDPATVSVSAAGKVRGLQSGGPVNITATANGIVSSPLSLTVNADPNYQITALTIAPFDQAILPVGDTRTHNARATYTDGTNTGDFDVSEDVIWFSDNEAVVTINKGVATGAGKGNTEIGARLDSPVISSNKLPIYVDFTTPQAVLEISPIQGPSLLVPTFTFQAKAMKKDINGSSEDVTGTSAWSSSDTSVLSVSNDNGFVSVVGAGTAKISATFGSITGSREYTVTDFDITKATVVVREQNPVGVTVDVRVIAETNNPGETTDISDYVTLSAFDPQIASVSNDEPNKSTVTGVQVGSTSIRATLVGGSGPIASRDVSFIDSSLTAIQVVPNNSPDLPQGAKQNFTANGTFVIGSGTSSFDVTRQVTFKSSDTAIVGVSNAPENKGEVHGLAVGTANITASYETIISPAVAQQVTPGAVVSTAITPADSTFALSAVILQFSAVATYQNMDTRDVTKEVTWLSSDSMVAAFSADAGRLFALDPTSSPVTIRAVVPGATETANGTTTLTITDAAATGVMVNATATTIKQGESLPLLTATASFNGSGDHDVTLSASWASDNGNVVVNKGVVTGVTQGTSTVTVGFGGFSDTIEISVTAP
jgi:hypothetical protein